MLKMKQLCFSWLNFPVDTLPSADILEVDLSGAVSSDEHCPWAQDVCSGLRALSGFPSFSKCLRLLRDLWQRSHRPEILQEGKKVLGILVFQRSLGSSPFSGGSDPCVQTTVQGGLCPIHSSRLWYREGQIGFGRIFQEDREVFKRGLHQ